MRDSLRNSEQEAGPWRQLTTLSCSALPPVLHSYIYMGSSSTSQVNAAEQPLFVMPFPSIVMLTLVVRECERDAQLPRGWRIRMRLSNKPCARPRRCPPAGQLRSPLLVPGCPVDPGLFATLSWMRFVVMITGREGLTTGCKEAEGHIPGATDSFKPSETHIQ